MSYASFDTPAPWTGGGRTRFSALLAAGGTAGVAVSARAGAPAALPDVKFGAAV